MAGAGHFGRGSGDLHLHRGVREGSMEGPQILRPLPFCSKELPFFLRVQITHVAESSWCADGLKGLKDQLRGVLN